MGRKELKVQLLVTEGNVGSSVVMVTIKQQTACKQSRRDATGSSFYCGD